MYSKTVNKDQFYTKYSVAKQCIAEIDLSKYGTIIEPSAGHGAFSNQIPECFAMDLEPKHPKVFEANWFDYDVKTPRTLVIGNPPFGIRCKLAVSFVKHASSLGADCIAFILPNVFLKPTYANMLKGYKLTKVVELPDNSFIANDEEYHVPCSFFVWERASLVPDKADLTWKKGTYTTEDFIFVEPCDYNPDTDVVMKQAISKVMAGGQELYSKSGRHLVRPMNMTKEQLIDTLNKIEYKGYSAVNGGVMALCQEEVVRNYLEAKQND